MARAASPTALVTSTPGLLPARRPGLALPLAAGSNTPLGKQWSLGLEYLYADFGKSATEPVELLDGGSPNDDHSQILRGRLNYRFGWDGLQK